MGANPVHAPRVQERAAVSLPLVRTGVLLMAAASASAVLFLVRPPAVKRPPSHPELILRAAEHTSAMSLESEPSVIRFGTPAAEVHEVHGFEHVRPTRPPSLR
jgi:hypothetical protein